MVERLVNSNSFKETQTVLNQLVNHKEGLSKEHTNSIVQAAIENNQIYWIAHQTDINAYLRTLTEGFGVPDLLFYIVLNHLIEVGDTPNDLGGFAGQSQLRVNWRAGKLGDFTGDGQIGFDDFLLFAGHFGKKAGDQGWDSRFDLDGNGEVGFGDFLVFASRFGK